MRNYRTRGIGLVLAVWWLAAGGLPVSAEDTPEAALAKADSFRLFAEGGFSYDFWSEDAEGEVSLMRVSVLFGDADESALVRYLEPVSQRGRAVLVRGNTFWLYEPGMKSALRISPRQILFGQASAGDVSRISFGSMYAVVSMRAEGDEVHFALAAKPGAGATYDLVDLATDRDYKPIEARCRGTSGTLMKTIRYGKYATTGGKVLLAEFSIVDEIHKKEQRVKLSRYDRETPPRSAFSVQALRRIR